MASVKTYTDKIRKARYGKEVRSSIADSIDIINEESEASVKKVNQAEANVNKAVTDAINATNAASTAASAATTAANNANEAAQAIFDEKYILTARTEFAKSARVSPTAKGNAILEKLRGDSWQKQLIGKNKFDITTMLSSLAKRNDGCFKNANGDTGSICNIPVVAGQTYTVTAYILGATTQSAWLRLSVQDGKDVKYTSFDDSIVTVVGLTTEYVKTVVTFTALSDWISISSLGSIRDDMQVELGETSTDFEEFCGNTTSPNPSYEQKVRSVGDMGWFDGELRQGTYDEGGNYIAGDGTSVCNVTSIPCKGGDLIAILRDVNATPLIYWWGDNGFISGQSSPSGVTAPSDATHFDFVLYSLDGITPSTVGHVCVTINGKYALIADERNDNLFGGLAFANALVQSGTTTTIDRNAKTVTLKGDANTKKFSYTKFKENTQYTFIVKGINTISSDARLTNLQVRYADGTTSGLYFSTDRAATKMLTQANKSVVGVYGNWNSGIAVFDYEYFGIFEGNVAIEDFTPHESTRHYIPLDEPLRGINGVADEVVPQEGVYGGYRPIDEVVFDGSESGWTYNPTYKAFAINVPNLKIPSIDETNYICSHLQPIPNKSNWANLTNWISNYNTNIYFYNNGITTVDEWKTWLQANPITVQYELETPTFTPFEDQTPFYNLMAYDEVTHVSIVGHEELEPMATIRFPRNEDGALETTNHCEKQLLKIENKAIRAEIEELTAALLALGRE